VAGARARIQVLKERTIARLQPHQSPESPPIIYENSYHFGLGTSHRAKGVSEALLDKSLLHNDVDLSSLSSSHHYEPPGYQSAELLRKSHTIVTTVCGGTQTTLDHGDEAEEASLSDLKPEAVQRIVAVNVLEHFHFRRVGNDLQTPTTTLLCPGDIFSLVSSAFEPLWQMSMC
jgi:hypothetical protein